MTHTLLRAALAASLCTVAVAAQAQSASLSAWAAAGDVRLEGPSSATLSTAAVGSGETPLSANSALLYFVLEPALGISAGTLPADMLEGSGLASSFSIGTPTVVSFDWVLASNEPFDAGFADRGFVVVDGSTLLPLGVLAANPVGGSFSISFSVPGVHSLAIGLMDVNDSAGVSTLSLSQFSVSAVPEPAGWALMLAGAGALGWLRRRHG